jgi:hypothetical protein
VDNAEFERRIVAEAPDGVLYADQEASFASEMPAATAFSALPARSHRAAARHHYSGHLAGAPLAGLYAQTMRSGQTRYGAGDLLAVPALRQDGRRISVEFCIIPFRDSAGAMAGIGAIMRDVTNRFEEIKALRRALRASKPQKTD